VTLGRLLENQVVGTRRLPDVVGRYLFDRRSLYHVDPTASRRRPPRTTASVGLVRECLTGFERRRLTRPTGPRSARRSHRRAAVGAVVWNAKVDYTDSVPSGRFWLRNAAPTRHHRPRRLRPQVSRTRYGKRIVTIDGATFVGE
jgi:hypothetical protein